MSRQVSYTSATTQMLLTSSATTGSYNFTTSTNANSAVTNAYTNADSASSARLTLTASRNSTRQSTVYFEFDKTALSDIPSEAEITSVAARVKYKVSSTSYVTAVSIQLHNNTTAKGSATTARSTTDAVYTMTAGTWTISELQNIRLYVSATHNASTNNAYLYLYGADVVVNYSLNGTEYEVSFNNQSSDVTTDPSSTQYVFEGSSQEITFSNADLDAVSITDNGTDISGSLVYHAPGTNSHQVDSVAGASYGFSLDGQYYKSQNAGYASSAAVCRINITAETQCTLTIYFVNYAEATYDYGIIGNLDSALSTTSATTTDAKWVGSASSANTSSEQNVTFDVPSGNHFVDIKYRKDNYTDSNNDAFWFRYELYPESSDEHYSYTISNIQSDHVISIEDAGGTFYTATTVSNYAGATISPSEKNVREGKTFTANISVANLYEIIVKDNGTVVTGSLVQNATGYTYTTPAIYEAHTITVEENTYYNVTTSSTYAGATATANPSKVYSGQSSVVDIDVENLYEVIVKDNGTDVTSSIVETQSEVNSVTFIPTEFISSASSYVSVYNSNNPENGLTNSGSTTRCCVYSNTGSGAESKLTYKFDCSTIPQNATITNVECSVKCSVYQTTYFATRTVQLYNGDTAKGTPTTISATGSNGTAITTNGGNWTREELNDISIVQRVLRGTSNTTTDASFSFFGATLKIDYTVPASKTYTLTNVNTNHSITIEEAPYNTVSTTSSYAGATISANPSKVYGGRSSVVTVSVANLYEIVVSDNGSDVTGNLVGSNGTYTYTISNVSANHTVSVAEATKYEVSTSSKSTAITISSSVYVYSGQSTTVTITGSLTNATVKDNGTDVTALLSGSGNAHTYTISNISSAHSVVVHVEADYAKVDGSFMRIKKYYRKENGEWTEITKTLFETGLSAEVVQYGGHFTGATIVGEVVKDGTSIQIQVSDNALEPGTYKFVYEDSGKNPLGNVDEIKEFTIS